MSHANQILTKAELTELLSAESLPFMKTQLAWFFALGLMAQLFPVSAAIAGSREGVEIQRAELQFALCQSTPVEIVDALGARVVERESRQAYYLETDQRDLQANGVVIRYRQTKRQIKSSVKKAFELVSQIPSTIGTNYGADCEVDAYLSRAKIGCSVKEKPAELGDLTDSQRRFLKLIGVSADVASRARIFGPVRHEALELAIGRDSFSLDVIHIPGGAVLSELSIRVPLADALGAQSRVVETLRQSGLVLCESQLGVTKKILDHYLGPAT